MINYQQHCKYHFGSVFWHVLQCWLHLGSIWKIGYHLQCQSLWDQDKKKAIEPHHDARRQCQASQAALVAGTARRAPKLSCLSQQSFWRNHVDGQISPLWTIMWTRNFESVTSTVHAPRPFMDGMPFNKTLQFNKSQIEKCQYIHQTSTLHYHESQIMSNPCIGWSLAQTMQTN